MKVKQMLWKKTPLQLKQYGDEVASAVQGNPNFPTPNPTPLEIQNLSATLGTAIAAYDDARQLCEEKRVIRDEARRALMAALTNLGSYVENASAGDEVKILSAHMQVQNPPTPVGPLPAPQNIRALANGSETSAHIEWDRVPGSKGYTVQSSEEPTGPWRFDGSVSKAQANVNNLQTGSRRYFRVCAFGAEGNGPWSDIAMKIIGA